MRPLVPPASFLSGRHWGLDPRGRGPLFFDKLIVIPALIRCHRQLLCLRWRLMVDDLDNARSTTARSKPPTLAQGFCAVAVRTWVLRSVCSQQYALNGTCALSMAPALSPPRNFLSGRRLGPRSNG